MTAAPVIIDRFTTAGFPFIFPNDIQAFLPQVQSLEISKDKRPQEQLGTPIDIVGGDRDQFTLKRLGDLRRDDRIIETNPQAIINRGL